MDDLWSYVRDHPWIWAVLLAGLATWIAALAAIFRSPKFRRKWLWVLLACFSFTWSWEIAPGVMFGIGFPIGALYVLWYWKFGATPPAAEHEPAAAELTPPAATAPNRVALLRGLYLTCALGVLLLALLSASGALTEPLFAGAPFPQALVATIATAGATALVAAAALFVWLALRQPWWGKFIAAWAALSWVGFGAVSFALMPAPAVSFSVLAVGLTVLATAVAHHLIDRRLA